MSRGGYCQRTGAIGRMPPKTMNPQDGHREPLAFWVVEDTAKVYGVAIDGDGKIDLTRSMEDLDGFEGYVQESNNNEEAKNGR